LKTRKKHSIQIEESSVNIFDILQDVNIWNDLFKPTIYAKQLTIDNNKEIIEIAALSNGLLHRWQSKRIHFTDEMKITFEQIKPNSKIEMMKGEWIVEPLGSKKTKVYLNHEYIAVREYQEFIDRAVEKNSKLELEGLKKSISQILQSKKRYFRSTKKITLNCSKKICI